MKKTMTLLMLANRGIFSPLNVSGLAAWWDFSTLTTLFQDAARTTAITADAQTILGVTDKSGAGNHLSESSDGPSYKVNIQNSRSAALFNGTSNRLLVNSLAATFSGADKALYALIVAQYSADPPTNQDFLGITAVPSAPLMLLRTQGAQYDLFRRDDANASKRITTGTIGTDTIVAEYVFTGTVGSIYINGTQSGVDTDLDLGTTTLTAATVGARSPATQEWLKGYIMEMCIYSAVPSAADRAVLRSYINSKWAVY